MGKTTVSGTKPSSVATQSCHSINRQCLNKLQKYQVVADESTISKFYQIDIRQF